MSIDRLIGKCKCKCMKDDIMIDSKGGIIDNNYRTKSMKSMKSTSPEILQVLSR